MQAAQGVRRSDQHSHTPLAVQRDQSSVKGGSRTFVSCSKSLHRTKREEMSNAWLHSSSRPSQSLSAPHAMVAAIQPEIYALSPEYTSFVGDVPSFRVVILKKMGELGAKLPQMSGPKRTQAKADLTYLKAIVEGAEPAEAQINAGAVFSAREHVGPRSPEVEAFTQAPRVQQ